MIGGGPALKGAEDGAVMPPTADEKTLAVRLMGIRPDLGSTVPRYVHLLASPPITRD